MLERGEQVVRRRELLLGEQDQAVLERDLHGVGLCDEVGRKVTAVEAQALHQLERGFEPPTLLDRDHAPAADAVDGLGDQLAGRSVAVGAHGGDVLDVRPVLERARLRSQRLHDRRHRSLDAAPDLHRAVPGRDRPETARHDGVREHRGSCGAVPRDLAGLERHLLHELRAHVLEAVGQLDLARDREPVVGDGGGAVAVLDHDVAAAGPQRHAHDARELVHAAAQRLAGVIVELDALSHGCSPVAEVG